MVDETRLPPRRSTTVTLNNPSVQLQTADFEIITNEKGERPRLSCDLPVKLQYGNQRLQPATPKK